MKNVNNECEHSQIRIQHVENIIRTPKLHTVYSHSRIVKGCCMCGSGTKVFQTDGTFGPLNTEIGLKMTKDEAEIKLKTLKK